MTKYFHFLDVATGEYFSVADESLNNAKAIARENFADPVFCGILDEEDVDILGEDVYQDIFSFLDYYYFRLFKSK